MDWMDTPLEEFPQQPEFAEDGWSTGREWFDRPENAYMFRPAFREYIAKNFPKPAPAPVAAAS